MKLMKKALTVLLVGAMCTGLFGCGSNQNSTDSTKKEGENTSTTSTNVKTGMTIAQNSFVAGDYAFSTMAKASKVIVEGTKNKFKELTDNANINNVQSDVENMINSGVDGALWWGVLDSYFQVGPQNFNNASKYFAFFDCAPSTAKIQDPINKMQYYAGSCIGNDEEFGKQMAEQALKDGCKEAIVFANEIGSSVAKRADKFKEVFEAGGGKVDEISHVGTAANAHIEAIQNMLATYKKADCIYGVSIAYATGAYSVTSQMPNRKVNIYATDITPDALKYLKNNNIQGLNGGAWVNAYVASALLINAIDGNTIKDSSGNPANLVVNPVAITPKQAELYEKFWINEMPYAYDDLKNLLYRENSKVTYDDFKKFVDEYSFSTVVENKLKQGKVTQKELDDAGVKLK